MSSQLPKSQKHPDNVEPNKKSVIVVGGGIGGLSVAHELVERGFDVTVFEQNTIPGGKARSMYIEGSGKAGRRSLPAEHGFRFFPGFYKHVIDTMSRIPYRDNPNGVADNLVDVKHIINTRLGQDFYPWSLIPEAQLWNRADQVIGMLSDLGNGIPEGEAAHYFQKIWQFWTSSSSRIFYQYEKMSWWEFVEAENKSAAFKQYAVKGATTQTVASKANLANAATIGNAGIRMVIDTFVKNQPGDRALNGPTNEVWIQPWIDHLRSKGAKYKLGHSLEGISFDGNKVTGVTISHKKLAKTFHADFYVLALPVEVVTRFITPEMIVKDRQLEGLSTLQNMTEWMNGIMFYLNTEFPQASTHMSYLDSPWALTSIAQSSLWRSEYDLHNYGNGKVKDILSVVISDWDTPGELHKKPAMACTSEEIKEEVWFQLEKALNDKNRNLISYRMIEDWYLDPDIQDSEINPHKKINLEPLLVNLANSWRLRPNAHTKIPNMMFAADFVRTTTDLATMEAANEAGRRAVNAILDTLDSKLPRAELFSWERPWYLKPLLWYDAVRFRLGLPWQGAPLLIRLGYRALLKIHGLVN